jgi:hypothetical protein
MEILKPHTVEDAMDALAGFIQDYTMRGQHGPDRSMTRYRHDLGKMVENNEITTGPGRYRLGVPNAYGNATFAPNPTVRQQKWGASHDMTSTKTDVESDLRNLGRPTTRTACGQYSPVEGAERAARLVAMPEADFPQTHARLVDPPCTLRSSGWNRWEWLCQNPQENVMVPFEWNVDSRHAIKDAYYHAMDKPLERSQAVQERQFMCGELFVEPAIPVARAPGPKDAPNFSDAVPGAPQNPVAGAPPAAHFTPRGGPRTGPGYSDAPYLGPTVNPLDRHYAETGVLEAPPPFTAYIAPH